MNDNGPKDLEAIRELEVTLFDEWTAARRDGRPVAVEVLLARLPVGRRAEFRLLLATTHKLQDAAAAFRELSAEETRAR